VHISRGIDLPCCSTRASNFDFGWSVAPTDSNDASTNHCDAFVVVATGWPIGAARITAPVADVEVAAARLAPGIRL